ncbi:hypothetical protein GUJ93_ZPchr0060g7199 [Zizania palustris]|uniref:Uncharacterized protein n=1 Tax=Zizania palustris TaxID=103762 RepID=A0A8J5R8M2_ZIZPA|nr:hypothetical protein GUJ93_ZPchr0060g7199 [Zizania palustris]
MTAFVPTAEDMQAHADLQQAVANLRAYLGLAPVASTLPSSPHGAMGFPHRVVTHLRCEPPSTPGGHQRHRQAAVDHGEAATGGFPLRRNPATTDGRTTTVPQLRRPIPHLQLRRGRSGAQLLPHMRMTRALTPEKDGGYVGGSNKDRDSEMTMRTQAHSRHEDGWLPWAAPPTGADGPAFKHVERSWAETEGLTASSFSATRVADFPGAVKPTGVDRPSVNAASAVATETEGAGATLYGVGTRTRWRSRPPRALGAAVTAAALCGVRTRTRWRSRPPRALGAAVTATRALWGQDEDALEVPPATRARCRCKPPVGVPESVGSPHKSFLPDASVSKIAPSICPHGIKPQKMQICHT